MKYLNFSNECCKIKRISLGVVFVLVFFSCLGQLKAVICSTSVIDSIELESALPKPTQKDPNVLLRGGKWVKKYIFMGMDYTISKFTEQDTESRRDRVARKLLIMGLIISVVSGFMFLLSFVTSGGLFATLMREVFSVVGSILSLVGLGLSIGGFAAAEYKEKIIGLAIAALVVSIIMAGYGVLYLILAQR